MPLSWVARLLLRWHLLRWPDLLGQGAKGWGGMQAAARQANPAASLPGYLGVLLGRGPPKWVGFSVGFSSRQRKKGFPSDGSLSREALDVPVAKKQLNVFSFLECCQPSVLEKIAIRSNTQIRHCKLPPTFFRVQCNPLCSENEPPLPENECHK